jgi:hypothetical protein
VRNSSAFFSNSQPALRHILGERQLRLTENRLYDCRHTDPAPRAKIDFKPRLLSFGGAS